MESIQCEEMGVQTLSVGIDSLVISKIDRNDCHSIYVKQSLCMSHSFNSMGYILSVFDINCENNYQSNSSISMNITEIRTHTHTHALIHIFQRQIMLLIYVKKVFVSK